jgi:hypothetical protein
MLTGLAAMILTTSLLAQDTPNFAGTWTLVPDAGAPQSGGRGGRGGGAGGGMLGLGQQATIAQDAKTLTITRTTQVGEMKIVYNLDSSKSTNRMTFGKNSFEQVSVAKWDGARLVITTSLNAQGTVFEATMQLSLEGGNLAIETTRPDFLGGGSPITTKLTYKKS